VTKFTLSVNNNVYYIQSAFVIVTLGQTVSQYASSRRHVQDALPCAQLTNIQKTIIISFIYDQYVRHIHAQI